MHGFSKRFRGVVNYRYDKAFIYAITDNRIFSEVLKTEFSEPLEMDFIKGFYDAYEVYQFNEEMGVHYSSGIFLVPSDKELCLSDSFTLLFSKEAFLREIYAVSSDVIDTGEGAFVNYYDDACYSVDDIIKHQDAKIVPPECIPLLLSYSNNESGKFVTGYDLYGMCVKAGIEPLLNLNTKLIRSSHFSYDATNRFSDIDSEVAVIKNGVLLLTNSLLCIYSCGNGYYIAPFSPELVEKYFEGILSVFEF